MICRGCWCAKEGIVEREGSQGIELSVSDPAQFGPLEKFLRWAVPDVGVSRVAGRPGLGEQGALDALTVLAGSGGLLAAVRVLPDFLRSRRSGLSVTMVVKGEPVTLTATNIEEVMPILERLLDA
jgi:membrane-associated two-gene conflict system component 1 (EACC1)